MANTIDANILIQATNGYSLIVVTYGLDGADFTPDYLEITESNLMSDLSPVRFPGVPDEAKTKLTFNVYLKYAPPKLTVNFGVLVGDTAPETRELTPTTNGVTNVDGSFIPGLPDDGMTVLDANDKTDTASFSAKSKEKDASILHITSEHFSHLLKSIGFASDKASVETFTEPRLESDPEYVHVFIKLPASESNLITISASPSAPFKPGMTSLVTDYAPDKKNKITQVMIVDTTKTTRNVISPYTSPVYSLQGDNKVQIIIPTQSNNIDKIYYCIIQKPDTSDGNIEHYPNFSSVGSSDGRQSKEILLDNTSLPINYSEFNTPFYMNAYTAATDATGNVLLSPGEPFVAVIDGNNPPVPPQGGKLPAPTLSAYSPIVNNNVDDASPVKANATLDQIQDVAPTATSVEFSIYIRGYHGPNIKNDIITATYSVDNAAAPSTRVTADFDVNKLKGYDSSPSGSPSQMRIQYKVISSTSEPIYSAITNYQIDTTSPFFP